MLLLIVAEEFAVVTDEDAAVMCELASQTAASEEAQ